MSRSLEHLQAEARRCRRMAMLVSGGLRAQMLAAAEGYEAEVARLTASLQRKPSNSASPATTR